LRNETELSTPSLTNIETEILLCGIKIDLVSELTSLRLSMLRILVDPGRSKKAGSALGKTKQAWAGQGRYRQVRKGPGKAKQVQEGLNNFE